MKRKLLAIILTLVMMFALVGCSERTENGNKIWHIAEGVTFIRVGEESPCIWVHKETRVMYLYRNAESFIVMLDADGKPLLWEGEL